MSDCGLVILAAGGASRMGRPKQLLTLQGKTLLVRCVQTALATTCRPVCIVLGADAAALCENIASMNVSILVNPHWQSGIGTSIRLGVSAIAAAPAKPGAVALLLCDQPLVSAAAIKQLIAAQQTSGKPIAAAAYAGTLGTPAVFAASLFGELQSLADHEGGKSILARHAAEIESVDTPQAAFDIDTEADFTRLIESFPASIQ